jgi:streptogramin lyase
MKLLKLRSMMRLLVAVLVFPLVFSLLAVGQGAIITTVAGGGPNNLPAVEANLSSPQGVAADGSGNLYIVAQGQSRVFKIDALGELTVVAGNGTGGYSGDGGAATSASLQDPFGVALDGAGNLFIADTSNHRIRRVEAGTGVITTVAGNGSFGFAGDGGAATSASLANPFGVALDGAGNLFIADAGNQRIRRVEAGAGIITTVAGNGTSGFAGDGGPATSARPDCEMTALSCR